VHFIVSVDSITTDITAMSPPMTTDLVVRPAQIDFGLW
jgi:hypothetical protein